MSGDHVVFQFLCRGAQDRDGFPALLHDVLPGPVLAFHRGIKLVDGNVNQPEPACPIFHGSVHEWFDASGCTRVREILHAYGAGDPIQAQGQQFFGDGLRLLGGQGQPVFFEEIGGDGRGDELNESFRGLLGLFGHGVLGTTGPLIASLSHWERVARSAG